MDQGVGRVEGLNFGETTTRKVTVTGGKKRERANQIGNTYAIRVTTTTREDFNMHRLTDVPQHADFKCKYKSAMHTAELVWAALGWRRFRKGCERIAYNGGRTISRVPPLLCIRVYACVCVYACEFSWNRVITKVCLFVFWPWKSILEGTARAVCVQLIVTRDLFH